MNIFTKRILAFSVLHFTVLLTSIVVNFSLGMSRFDSPEMKESLLEI